MKIVAVLSAVTALANARNIHHQSNQTQSVHYPLGNTTAIMPTATGAPIVASSSSMMPVMISASYGAGYSAAPAPTTLATAVRPEPSQGGAGTIPHYWQCGGLNWKGSATCAAGLVCKDYNPYYSQCITPEDSNPVGGQGSTPAPTASSEGTPAPMKTPTYPGGTEPSVVVPAANEPTSSASSPSYPEGSGVPAGTKPTPSASSPSYPMGSGVTIPSGPAGKLYTLDTFIAFLKKEAGSDSAEKIRRMIEALQ